MLQQSMSIADLQDAEWHFLKLQVNFGNLLNLTFATSTSEIFSCIVNLHLTLEPVRANLVDSLSIESIEHNTFIGVPPLEKVSILVKFFASMHASSALFSILIVSSSFLIFKAAPVLQLAGY